MFPAAGVPYTEINSHPVTTAGAQSSYPDSRAPVTYPIPFQSLERNPATQSQQTSHIDIGRLSQRWTDGGHGTGNGAAVERIVQIDDGFDADALTELAGLELQAGRFAQARDMYKRALTSRPGDAAAATGEARALAGLGDAPAARALLERVLLAHPNFAPAVQAKAQLSEAAPR